MFSVFQLGHSGILGERVATVTKAIGDWFSLRKSVLVPRWIRGLYKMLVKGDHKVCIQLHLCNIVPVLTLSTLSGLFHPLYLVDLSHL